jgi:hypothetical protein
MNIATKLFCMFSLCTALPNFCMNWLGEMDQETEVEIPAEVVVLDDGRKWINPQKWQDVTQFAGKVVAYKSPYTKHLGSLQLDSKSGVLFGVVSELTDSPYYHGCGFRLYTSTKAPCFFHLTTVELQDEDYFMRLLTYDEICRLSSMGKRRLCGVSTRSCCEFTLDNLLEEEHPKYFRNQVLKTMWQWQRLLHIGKKDLGSALGRLPKDMIHLLTQFVLNAQAQELMANAEPDERLDL